MMQSQLGCIKKERTTTPTSRKKETSGGSAATKDSKEMPEWQKRALERKKKTEAEKAIARSMSSSRLDKSHRLGQKSPTNSLTTSTRSPISGRRSAEMKKSDSTTTSESGTRSLRMRYGRNAEEKAGLSKSVEVGGRVKSLRADSKYIEQTNSPKCSIRLASSVDSEKSKKDVESSTDSTKKSVSEEPEVQDDKFSDPSKMKCLLATSPQPNKPLSRSSSRQSNASLIDADIRTFHSHTISITTCSPTPPVSGSGPKASSNGSVPEWKKKLLKMKSNPTTPTRTKAVPKEPEMPAWKKELMAKKANEPDDKVGVCCMASCEVI